MPILTSLEIRMISHGSNSTLRLKLTKFLHIYIEFFFGREIQSE